MIILNVFDPKDFEVFTFGHSYKGKVNVQPLSLKTWAQKSGADWVFNLAFFDFASAYNNSKGIGGRTLQPVYSSKVGQIGCDDAAKRTDPIEIQGSSFCGWTTAIKDGVIHAPNLNRTQYRARNMNGLTADGRYIHVTTSKMTELQVATEVNRRIQRDYKTKVKYLFVEDSGGSTQEYSAITKLAYTPEGYRDVASVMCVKRKTPYTFTRTIHRGMIGEDVRILQQALGGIEVDGIAGWGTDARIRQAQRALGVAADGYAGPKTYKAMGYF